MSVRYGKVRARKAFRRRAARLIKGRRPVIDGGRQRMRHSHKQPHMTTVTIEMTTPTIVSTGWRGGSAGGGIMGGAGGKGGGGDGA